jgi:ribonuclease D
LYAHEISHDQLAALPIRRYEGPVHLVETAEDLERAAQDLRNESVVGFDTETRPAFKPGESYLPCLAQAATARAVHIFPLARLDCSSVVTELLSRSETIIVGVSLADDLKKLKLLFPFEEASIVDAGIVAKRHGVRQSGLRNLAGIFMGFRVPKGKRTSNWAARHLSEAQITYAATDAWACRELYLRYRELGLAP